MSEFSKSPSGSLAPRYEGEWLNDLKHGHGEEHFADGGRFSGCASFDISITAHLGIKILGDFF